MLSNDLALTYMRSRRRTRWILAGALISATLVGSAALRPSDAHAWAWKDTCTALVYNRTGSQGAVRPSTYIPILPSAAGLATFATFAIVGIPTSGAIPFPNTGYPVPSYGCHATLTFFNPGSNVACAISAPTTGANHFNCSGNATVQVITDNDDITGNVSIPSGSAVGSRPPNGRLPTTGPGALRRAELPGAGWRATTKVTDVGLLGRLMNDGTLPRSCRSRGSQAAPSTVGSTQFVRRGGSEGVGGVAGTFASARQASGVLADALSRRSIGCLARLLTSSRLHTTVSIVPAATGQLGRGLTGRRLVVQRHAGRRVTSTQYVDVVATTHGRRFGLTMLESSGRPTRSRVGRAAVGAVLRRIGA